MEEQSSSWPTVYAGRNPKPDPKYEFSQPTLGPRIHGELQKLGINLAQATVAKYMVPHPCTVSGAFLVVARDTK
jgi:hypothetical protein